jgi:adenylate cyclase
MKRFLKAFGWAALVAALQAIVFLSPWGESLETRFLDLWFNMRGPVASPEEVVVIAMDEDSYQILDFPMNQPWPRSAHAALLRRLKEAGVRGVVFDVLFFGEGPFAEVDDDLAKSMREVPTVIGAEVREVADQFGARLTTDLPLNSFRDAAKLGLVGQPEDGGRVRRFLLPEARYRDVQAVDGLPSLAAAATGAIREPGPRDFIHYYGPPRTIPTYSYYQVLEEEVPLPKQKLQDKIVFVGLSLGTETGPAQMDAFLTSYSQHGRTHGVEIHAIAAANLLRGDWIKRSSPGKETALLAAIALLATLGLLYLRPLAGGTMVIGVLAGWTALAYWSFLHGQFVPGATLAGIALPVAYTGATLSNYLTARFQQQRLERAFRFYLSPEMAREVARNPQALQLGGEEVECTALFTDIAGFTTVAEEMKPTEVGQMLNAYFTEVMEAVFEKRGTVIQFIGDGLFALWGAAERTSEHGRSCCEAALAIQAEIELFNQSERFPPLRTRFGISTGPVLVGNLGSTRRFDFTGIGDTVNLASRVEGLNKYFGTTILMTDSSLAQLPKDRTTLKMGLIRVVGKTQPVGLHTIFASAIAPPIAERWLEAWSLFSIREWEQSDGMFADISREEPRLAKAAAIYKKQIEAHLATPPASDWCGEIVFSVK